MSKYEDPKEKKRYLFNNRVESQDIFYVGKKEKKRGPAVGTFLLLLSEMQMPLGIYQLS